MRRIVFLLATALLARGAETHTLTLKQAVDRALAQNPEVVMARLDEMKAALGVRRGARARSRPRVDAGSGLAYSNGFPLSIEGSAPSIFQAKANAVPVQQAAELCGRAGEGEPRAERVSLRARRAMRSLTGWPRFISMSTARDGWPIRLQKQVESLEKVLQTAQARVEEGRELAVTAQEANVNLLRARQRLIALQSDREYAARSLAVTLGYGDGDLVNPAEEERTAPAIPANEEAAISDSSELQQGTQAAGIELPGEGA